MGVNYSGLAKAGGDVLDIRCPVCNERPVVGETPYECP